MSVPRRALWAAALTACVRMSMGVMPPPEPRRGVFQFGPRDNASLSIGNWTGTLATGSLVWPGVPSVPPAAFSLLSPLLHSSEVARMLEVVTSVEMDVDSDTVDDKATHEFYLERAGSVDGVRVMRTKSDRDSDVYFSRLSARQRLANITRPIIDQRILPFVNSRYAAACGSSCHVCHSLVRRYQQEERLDHPTHFDIQALVTVVVSLTSYGREFVGGLYVSTGSGEGGQEYYLALQAGDAVVHQSSLLHGVNVESGNRWSWIMWFQDKPGCDNADSSRADPTSWTAASAAAGDPLAQFLHAMRVESAEEKVSWLRASALQGFSRSQNELGRALLLGQGVAQNRSKGMAWLLEAADRGEPDAFFNLGLVSADEGDMDTAVELWSIAAAKGVPRAQFAMGLACQSGEGVERDMDAAAEWFRRGGDGKSLMFAAAITEAGTPSSPPDVGAAISLRKRACVMGHGPACLAVGKATIRAGDSAAGVAWLKKAVKFGDEAGEAQLLLGGVQQRARAVGGGKLMEL